MKINTRVKHLVSNDGQQIIIHYINNNSELKPERNVGSNGIRTRGLSDTGAFLPREEPALPTELSSQLGAGHYVEDDYMKGNCLNYSTTFFQHASDIHSCNIGYAAAQHLHKAHMGTNIGKQKISFQAMDLWKEFPIHFKELTAFAFSKTIKHYLLSDQYPS